jgi:hypothetical protein
MHALFVVIVSSFYFGIGVMVGRALSNVVCHVLSVVMYKL